MLFRSVDEDAKALPFAESEPGATGLELLLSLALKWSREDGVELAVALARLTQGPARVLGQSPGSLPGGLGHGLGQLQVGGTADVCVFDPQAYWTVTPQALRSQGKHTPFSGYELPGRVRTTLVGGRLAYQAEQ